MLELRQGAQLADRYTLVRRLGGDRETSQTWLARDRMTSASVALKIGADDLQNRQNSERLRREWQASIRLLHAHVVRVFEFHTEAGVAFFSQQFIDGPDIGALTGLPPADVLGPVGQLLDALQYVHAKGVVHRDIKASNVLIDANGALYLGDFGASGDGGTVASGGSLIAQSPQSLGGEPASAADDIFALGSLLYELLSGRPPWPSEDMAEHIARHAPPPLRAADGSVLPAAVERLVDRMLDKDAGRRPSAGEIAEELKAAGYRPAAATVRGTPQPRTDEAAESIEAIRPTSRPERPAAEAAAREPSGIGRNAVLAGLGVLIAALVAVVFVLPDNVARRSETAPPPAVVDPFEDAAPPVVVDDDVQENRPEVYVDPEVRRRVKGDAVVPTRKLEDDEDITFSENRADYSGLDAEGRARFDAELSVGELLSAFEVLEARGVERWAPREYRAARDLTADGDAAYLKTDFEYADELYLAALTVLEPLYERIEPTFEKAYADAVAAFETGDREKALQLFELAVAVTPSHAGAKAGYARARNLETVLRLVDQGLEYEEDLDLEAALRSYEQAAELDTLWQPAHDGVERVRQLRTKMEFDARMSEGFSAIANGDYLGARAAFRIAQRLIPGSSEPADGLLQVDQGLRLQEISTLEREVLALERDEHWDAAVKTYEEILKVDNTLMFAREGLARAREMSELHGRLDDLIAEPDKISLPLVMQEATTLVVSVTTRQDVGPRLAAQRDELSRLLKRAATPLQVQLVSNNFTDVSVYRIGRLGHFEKKELNLRPGTYIAVGSRPGYRDVRLEFRVAPEQEIGPVVVQCEEPI